jgi:hypothetical protein
LRAHTHEQVRLQVQRQLAQALFKLSVEFRKEETRFLNKMEAQKGLAAGSSIGLVEDEGPGGGGERDPGFTESQIQKVRLGWLATIALCGCGGKRGRRGARGALPVCARDSLAALPAAPLHPPLPPPPPTHTHTPLHTRAPARAQVSMAEVLIEERDEEIRKVVEAIAELAQIMRDLSTLVVEQGTMLDRIDANIGQAAVKVRSARAGRWRGLHAGAGARHRAGEHAALVLRAQHALCCVHTHTHPTAASRCACACSCACAWPCAQVEEGVKELVRAEKTQRQGRAMLCIIALLVLIVVMVIVIIVRHI